MILDKLETEFDTNSTGEIIPYQIEQSSRMFEAFSTILYKDAVKAVSREVSANSYDANVENNCEHIPVKIYLPGEFVVFSDNGIGLSPDRIRNVFCYFGGSTKTGTNSQIGGYGLGAKSPFSLASQFIIETIHEGIHYTYNASKDSEYKPQLILVDQRPTKLPSGTSIKIPVSYDLRWRFKDEIKFYTKFWKTPPEFVGYPPEEKLVPTLESDTWAIYLKDIGNCNVILGGIPYYDSKFNIPKRVVLKFPIGSLSTTLERDSLRYDDKTDNVIKAALAAYDKEVTEVVQKDLDNLDNFAEVLTLIESLPKAHEQRNWTWKGKTFPYPLVNPVVYYYRPRNKLSSYHTKVFDKTITEDMVVIKNKTDIITSYDRQKISYWMREKSISHIYLFPEDHNLPLKGINLSEIKIKRTPGIRGPRTTKTTIKGRYSQHSRFEDYLIDSPTVIVYTTNMDENTYHLPIIIRIDPKQEKHIIEEENWHTLDEYVQQTLYDKVDTSEIQIEADRQDFQNKYESFRFLSHLDDFSLLKKARSKKFTEEMAGIVKWLVGKGKVVPTELNVYAKYPLLNHLRYMNNDAKPHVIEYVTMVHNKSQPQSQLKEILSA